jgi:hypothetical protein
LTTPRSRAAAIEPYDGCTLSTYAAICRALVRTPRGTASELEAALADWGLTTDAWTRIRQGWSDRIANDADVRAAFRRIYVGEGT